MTSLAGILSQQFPNCSPDREDHSGALLAESMISEAVWPIIVLEDDWILRDGYTICVYIYVYIYIYISGQLFHDPRMGKNRTIYDIDNIYIYRCVIFGQ